MPRTLPALILLAGCGAGLTPYNLDPVDTDPLIEEAEGLVVDRIDPGWGPPGGGTEVIIEGAGFEGEVTVAFGRAQVDVTQMGPGTLRVTTPAAGSPAIVDVTITSGLGEVVLEDGFAFREWPPDGDTGEPPDDTGDPGDPDPTGLVGGIAQFTRTQVACPPCFNLTESLDINAQAGFHDPVARGWLDWIPPVGQCVTDPDASGPSVRLLDVGPWTYLQSGSSNVGLRRTSTQAGTLYDAQALAPSQWLNNSSFDVSVPDGGALGGSFTVPDALVTPQGFDTIEPPAMLYTSPDLAFTALISASRPTVAWSPSGGSGTFVVVVDVYSPDGAAYLGQVYCHGADNGAMTLPAAALSRYPAFSLLAVGLYRTWIDEAVIPVNGASLETLAQSGVLGTATLLP